jgi:hypothetical protein
MPLCEDDFPANLKLYASLLPLPRSGSVQRGQWSGRRSSVSVCISALFVRRHSPPALRMAHSIRKHLLFVTAAIPLGALSGYFCAFLVDAAACFFSLLFYSQRPYDLGTVFAYCATFSAPIGAILGAALLPVAYLALLRHITTAQILRVIASLSCGVVGAGLLASPFNEVYAFVAVFPGFLAGLLYAYVQTKERAAP